VHETNIAHLRYEADLLADEITQHINQRINALQRLNGKRSSYDVVDLLHVTQRPK